MHYQAIALLAAAAATKVAAAPQAQATANVLPPFLPADYPIAAGGALDPAPTQSPGEPAGDGDYHVDWAGQMTVTFANHDHTTLHLAHQRGKYSPGPVGYDNGAPDAHLPIGGHQVLEFPNGYNGVVFMNIELPGDQITGQDESVIEFSFSDQGQGYPVGDVDVSYVNGFSRPAICVCRENQIVAGCSKYLWGEHHCPDDNGVGSCRNPKRFDKYATSATEFFSPCNFHGGAFTFPLADANTLNHRCPSENYYCCIGPGKTCTDFANNAR